MAREKVSIKEMIELTEVKDKYPFEKINKLHANLALPSYVHGYSLAIEFMRDWLESKFEKNYFKSIFVDGRHVLQSYDQLSKIIVKGQNPRMRIEPRIDFDYDRETIDTYMAPPELYLRKSKYNTSFFRDYDRDIFLAFQPKALRMNFAVKIRVNTRAQQLDLYNRILLYCRCGSTMNEELSIDFHVPKSIILNIADRAGFEIKNDEVVDIIDFLNYLNAHSEIPFLFKMRAINQKPEYFIRLKNLYTHINCTDKPSLDDGERDGKLDFNFHIEMNIILTIPVPHFFAYYSASEMTTIIKTRESNEDCIALYSIQPLEIPNVDHNGWMKAATTDCMIDKGDTEIDISSLFSKGTPLARAVDNDLLNGVSPYHFINIVVYNNEDIAKLVNIEVDWKNKIIRFVDGPRDEEILHIAIYYDREYINNLDISLNEYNKSRIK